MKKCVICGNKFCFKDRLKSILKHPFQINLECGKCRSIYKAKKSMSRFIYYFIVLLTFSNLQNILSIFIKNYNRSWTVFFLEIIATVIFLLLFDLVGHKYQHYKLIKNKSHYNNM